MLRVLFMHTHELHETGEEVSSGNVFILCVVLGVIVILQLESPETSKLQLRASLRCR